MEEEPVYEVEPEPEPENDYEDVEEISKHDEEAEGDYEDVLEPEDSSAPSAQAGKWWCQEWGRTVSRIWSSFHMALQDLCVCLLHVAENMLVFLIVQDHQAAEMGLWGSQLSPCMITKEVSVEGSKELGTRDGGWVPGVKGGPGSA